jgi:hypothetical protein
VVRRAAQCGSITIDHLLHHTSGLPDHVHLPEFQAEWTRLTMDAGDFDPERLMTFVAGREPLFEAGQVEVPAGSGAVIARRAVLTGLGGIALAAGAWATGATAPRWRRRRPASPGAASSSRRRAGPLEYAVAGAGRR